MRALTWQGRGHVSVETVPDPTIEQPNDVVIEVTSTAICGSDLHLYEVLGPFLTPGDVLGHETMGVVVERGPEAGDLQVGDRVVVPFNISCGSCWMCSRGLYAQCETTQVREQGKGASLFGYTSLYGSVPGGQAELLRVPQAQFGPVKVPEGVPDERYLYLSDILPTAWQAVRYADVGAGDTLAVFGLGPVGQLATRIGLLKGCRVIGVDLVPERLALAAAHGVEVIDLDDVEDPVEAVLAATDGRGADGTVDAVGMEAHGSPVAEKAIGLVGRLPDKLARPLTDKMAIDRTAALRRRDQVGAPRRDGVGVGRLRRRGRPDADDGDVRPWHHHAARSVPRPSVDRGDPQGARRVRGRARRRVAGHPPAAARERPRGLRDVPAEEGRLREGGAPPVNGAAPVLMVTGASSGIGRAVALRAARTGVHLVLVARDGAALAEVAEECESLGAAGACVEPIDIGDDAAVAGAVRRTLEREGRLDAVVNSAGVVAYGALPGRARRRLRRRAAHQPARCGQRRPPRPPGPAGPGPRATWCWSARCSATSRRRG